MLWCSKDPHNIARAFGSSLTTGLTAAAVLKLRREYGFNRLPEPSFSRVRAFLKQLKNPLALVLLFAAVATFFLGEYVNAVVIVVALLVNVFIGLYQQEKAADIFATLKKAQRFLVTVIRDGKRQVIDAEELVPGDVLLIESGMQVPADIRLVRSQDLLVNESVLTGEWVAVAKDAAASCDPQAPVAEQKNMLFKGTTVVDGSGLGIVVATGTHTVLGSIADQTTQEQETVSPIEKNIAHIAHVIMFAIAFILVFILILGIARGEPLAQMLLIAIAVAVAAMPEGLPATVTVVLALGMQRILQKGGLVKHVFAAQTLGSVTVILTDKTGTLTKGEMEITAALTASGTHELLHEPQEGIHPEVLTLVRHGFWASDAFVEEKDGTVVIHGRPIERAIVSLARQWELEKQQATLPRVDFARFSPRRRFALSLHQTEKAGIYRLILSGSPEHILEKATHIYTEKGIVKLDAALKRQLLAKQNALSRQGKRFIGVGYTEVKTATITPAYKEGDVPPVVFLGFLVLEDVIREDVPQAVKKAIELGVRVIMVTGDHPETARAIAYQAGITHQLEAPVCTGAEIASLTDRELKRVLANTPIFARVLPQQKLRIARLLKSEGEVVAMTGDGVNDAPALKGAHIGIAVGSGTDVAKSAADLILLQDSFAIIIEGIKEGRRIIDNIRKIVAYLLSGSFIEVVVIAGALVFALPLPILPTQLLWHNIISESFMAFPFAFEKRETALSRRPKDAMVQRILTPGLLRVVILSAISGGVLMFALYLVALEWLHKPLPEVRTMLFVALTLFTLFGAFAFRRLSRPAWFRPFRENRVLLAGVAASLLVLVGVFVIPPFPTMLSLTTFPLDDVALVTLFAGLQLACIELGKWLFLRR